MTSKEYEDWKAFYQVEPFGDARADYRAGVIASVVANANKKKSARRVKPLDFFPSWKRRKQSWEEQLSIVEALNVAFGGKDLRKNPVDT